MGCEPEQCIALGQGFPDEIEFPVFEITQTTMDHARGGGAAAGCEVVPLDQKHAQSLQRQIAIGGDAIDAAADHDDIEIAVLSNSPKRVLAECGHGSTVRWF